VFPLPGTNEGREAGAVADVAIHTLTSRGFRKITFRRVSLVPIPILHNNRFNTWEVVMDDQLSESPLIITGRPHVVSMIYHHEHFGTFGRQEKSIMHWICSNPLRKPSVIGYYRFSTSKDPV